MTNLHPHSQWYLHTNGSVIYKPHGDVDASSDFVKRVWNAMTVGKDPGTFATWLNELYNLGANNARIAELATDNKLFDHIPDLKPEFIRLGIIAADVSHTDA